LSRAVHAHQRRAQHAARVRLLCGMSWESIDPTVAPSEWPDSTTLGSELEGLEGGSADVCHFWHFAVAAALAGGSGVRATAPLFLLSLCNHIDPDEYPLSDESSWLCHDEVCVLLGVLLVVEVLADQIPAVDHLLHGLLTPAHTVTGGLAAIAPNYCGGWGTRMPMMLFGAATALTVHAGKSVVRGASSSASFGALNPVISACETIATIVVVLLCMTLPLFAVVMAVLYVYFGYASVRRIQRMRDEPEEPSCEDEMQTHDAPLEDATPLVSGRAGAGPVRRPEEAPSRPSAAE